MFFSTALISALAVLPATFAIPTQPNVEARATPALDDPNVFHPNISKVYDLLNYGSSFTQFCSNAGSSFQNGVDQRSMLHRFDFDESFEGRKCGLMFEATGITLYYNSSFPITMQLFTTTDGTPLPCEDNTLNNKRDKHIADITIYSSNGDVHWTNYTSDFYVEADDCQTSGSQGYEVAMTGEAKYAAWTLPVMGLMLRAE
ncbi:hypothetical protein BROUX41_001929 [Berkeleyomyces rouxiae]|uniref:uncharacterized protein n=1 Tax=Berkeleyomyces rouxiae TaxID=2035830 RepID=UPI003B7D7687